MVSPVFLQQKQNKRRKFGKPMLVYKQFTFTFCVLHYDFLVKKLWIYLFFGAKLHHYNVHFYIFCCFFVQINLQFI